MNKRQSSKIKSKKLIMTSSLNLFIKEGIINTSTAKIAKSAGVSHGSIFSHFASREDLISEVLEQEMFRITKHIKMIHPNHHDLSSLIDDYINVLSKNEHFLSRIYKELPFLSYDLQLKVTALEAVMRNTLYLTIKASTDTEKTDDFHIQVGLTTLFATIAFYLRNDTLYGDDTSVIQSKEREIKYTFNQFFRRI